MSGAQAVCVLAFEPDWISSTVIIPPALAAGFLAASFAVAAWWIVTFRSRSARIVQTSIWALAALLGFCFTGVVMTSQAARQPRVSLMLAEVEMELPRNQQLVSFGLIPHAFAYYYGEFIPAHSWPKADGGDELPTYFCFRKVDLKKHRLPFAWESLAEMSFEDDDEPSRTSYVVIARRLPTVAENNVPRRLH